MNHFELVSVETGYAFVKDALREVKVKSQSFFAKEDGGVGINLFVESRDAEFIIKPNELYASRKDYEDGNPCNLYSKFCNNIGELNVSKNILVLMDNGEVTEKSITIKKVTYNFETGEWIDDNPYDEDKCFHICDREKAISWAEYDQVNADGSVKHIVGASKQVMLNDKQKALVDELMGVLKKLKDNHVLLLTDMNDSVYAYNTENVDVSIDDDMYIDGMKSVDRFSPKFEIGRDIQLFAEYSEDFSLFVIPKNKE